MRLEVGDGPMGIVPVAQHHREQTHKNGVPPGHDYMSVTASCLVAAQRVCVDEDGGGKNPCACSTRNLSDTLPSLSLVSRVFGAVMTKQNTTSRALALLGVVSLCNACVDGKPNESASYVPTTSVGTHDGTDPDDGAASVDSADSDADSDADSTGTSGGPSTAESTVTSNATTASTSMPTSDSVSDGSSADDSDATSSATSGTSGETDDHPPTGTCTPAHDAATPALTGPYCVGVSQLHLVPGAGREELVYLFYPILPGSAALPALWVGEKEWPVLQGFDFSLPPGGWMNLWSNAVQDEAVAPGAFPLLTFMHGLGAHTAAYTASFIEPLASHGFIVAAINHPVYSGVVNFPDGHSVYGPTGGADDGTVAVMVGDAGFVVDHLMSDPKWQGSIDFARVGSYGHSLGGAISVELLVQDASFIAGMDADGRLFGSIASTGTTKPVFLMASEEVGFTVTGGDWGELWNRLTGPGYYARIAGTTHVGISDLGLLRQHFGGFGPGSIAPQTLQQITGQISQTFFAAHLADGDPAAVGQAAMGFGEVTFQQK